MPDRGAGLPRHDVALAAGAAAQGQADRAQEYINKFGRDMPEIRNWKWGATASLQSDGGCNKHSENDNLKEA